MYVTTITNQKGGSGKTTTAVQLMAGLAERGYRVLGVDGDPQHNFTKTMMGDIEAPASALTTYEALINLEAAPSIIEVPRGHLMPAALPSRDRLADLDLALLNAGSRNNRLRRVLDQVRDDYDYCVIDTRGAQDTMLFNALVAADGVVVPMNAAEYDTDGLERFFGHIVHEAALEREDRGLNKMCLLGLLIVRYQANTRLAKGMDTAAKAIADVLGTTVFSEHISPSVVVGESQYYNRDLFDYSPDSKPARDYSRWIDTFIELTRGE